MFQIQPSPRLAAGPRARLFQSFSAAGRAKLWLALAVLALPLTALAQLPAPLAQRVQQQPAAAPQSALLLLAAAHFPPRCCC